jgi:signal transduction histidine kinase
MTRTLENISSRAVLTTTFLLSTLPIALIVALPGLFARVMAPAPYVLFHNISELFSILVSLSIFGVGWFTFERSRDRHSLLLSAAFLVIGLLDLMHTLSNVAMPPFITVNSSNKSTQFWIAARLFQGIAFLACASVYSGRYGARLSKKCLLPVALLVPLSVFTLIIFYPQFVPDTYVRGAGLTPFKKISEYLCVGMMCASFVAYRRLSAKTGDRVLIYYQAALILCIVGELNFAVYTKVFDSFNILGHVYKVAAFLLIYKGIFIASIREPYRKLAEVSVSRDELRSVNEELHASRAAALGAMEEAQAARREAEETSEKLLREIAVRKRVEAALQRAHDELEAKVEERTAEIREKDQLLMQQSRQAAMGEMIGNIAHQWRQPLNALALLIGSLPMMHERGELSRGEIASLEEKTMGIIRHMSQTINDFSNYFKPEKEKVHFHAGMAVTKTLNLIRDSFSNRGITIEVETATDPVVTGYPNEFSQVLLNILLNAKDALLERRIGNPRVVIRMAEEQARAVVTVTDNAGGIPEEIIGKIFDPYFTTKGPEHGTGVGLFMSKGIIEKSMGGRLSARNTGTGAEFRIEV